MLCALQVVAEVVVQTVRPLTGHTQYQLAEPRITAARGHIITSQILLHLGCLGGLEEATLS